VVVCQPWIPWIPASLCICGQTGVASPFHVRFVRPHCVPNPKIAEIHLLRHCRDRDVMFGRRDMEHKATEVYRYYRSLRDSLSDSRLKSLKSFRSIPPCLSLSIDSATRPVPTSATFSYVPDSTFDAGPSLPINRHSHCSVLHRPLMAPHGLSIQLTPRRRNERGWKNCFPRLTE